MVKSGALILGKDSLAVNRLELRGPWKEEAEVVGITVSFSLGKILVVPTYVPPEGRVLHETWDFVISHMERQGKVLLCGDFNAHCPLWGALSSNFLGNQVSTAVYDAGLVPFNYSDPRFIPAPRTFHWSQWNRSLIRTRRFQ